MSGTSNSLTLTILIERQPDGEYAAIDEANNDLGWPVGYGETRRAAIDDLIEQMDERGLIIPPRDTPGTNRRRLAIPMQGRHMGGKRGPRAGRFLVTHGETCSLLC